MRLLIAVAALVLLSGCASDEYSKEPEAQGEWVPANPPGLTATPVPRSVPAMAHARGTNRSVAP